MIVRIKGGNHGVEDYLRYGYKSTSDFLRNDLDFRVILKGNLDITESVIKSISNKGQERYLHITLSFKENEIKESRLEEITNEYVNLLMTAYNEDEFNCYAEAHIPKIKRGFDKKNKTYFDRKPHIHIIIPKINLITNKNLNPVGVVNEIYGQMDGIQEHLNYKFNLQSPKDFLRIDNDYIYSQIISRSKGDTYNEKRGGEKKALIEKIINKEINSIYDFENSLSQLGEFKVRNKGKFNEYYAVKFEGDSKFTNLKSPLFNSDFIVNKSLKKIRLTPKETNSLVENWRLIKSKELKYIRPSNKSIRKVYHDLITENEKREFLNKLEVNYSKKFNLNNYEPISNEIIPDIELSQEEENLKSFYSNAENESLSNQAILKIKEDKEIKKGAINYNKQIHPKELIKFIGEHFLVDKNNYNYFIKKNGDFRIKVNGKIFSNSDLLTKHIGLPWEDAKNILDNILKDKLIHNKITNGKKQLKECGFFKKNISNLIKISNGIFYSQIDELIETVKKNEEVNFQQEINIFIFRKMQREEIINNFKNYITTEIKNFSKIKEVNIMANEQQFLSENGIIAPEPYSIDARIKEKEKETEYLIDNQLKLVKNNIGIAKKNDGTIEYNDIKTGKRILKDYGYGIFLDRGVNDEESIKLMLEISINKYGNTLNIKGNNEFKQKVIDVIIKNKLSVVMQDKSLQKQLIERRDLIKANQNQQKETIENLKDLKSINIGNKLLSNNDYREAYAQEAVNQGESELSVQSNISRLEQEAHRDNKINPNAITNPVITNPVEEAKNDYSLMAKGRMDQTVIYEKMLNSKEYENEIRAAIVAYAENLKQAGYKIENTHSYAQDEINTMKFFYENSRGNLLEASKENTVNIGNKLLSNNDYREAYAQEAVNQGESELSVQSNISRLEQEAHRDNKINPNAITNPVITNPVEEAKNDYSLMAKGRMDQTVIYEKMLNSKEYENEIRAAIVAYAENLKQAGYKIENTHSYAQDEINTMKFFYENSRGNLLEASKENTVNIGNKLLSNNDYREAYAQEAVNQGESELSVQSNISRLEQEAHRDNKINPNAITNPVITNPVEEAKNDYSLMAKGRMDQTVIYEKMLNSKEYENEIRAAIVTYAENLKQAGYKIENTHSYAQDEINTMKFFYEQSKGKQLDGVKSLLVDNEKIDVTFKLNKKTGNTECHILGSNLSTFNVADRENLIEAIIKSPSVREYINKTTREDLRNGIVNLQIDEPISISIDRLEENNKAKEVSLELEI